MNEPLNQLLAMQQKNIMRPMRSYKLILLAIVAGLLGGCASSSSKPPSQAAGYRTARAQSALEVPPDLINTSTSSLQQSTAKAGNEVLPGLDGIVMRSSGNDRWLEIKATADAVWNKALDYANKSGVPILVENKRDGIMETDWIGDENSESQSKRMMRASLGSIVGRPPVNDKYILWLEKVDEQTTALHVSHSQLKQFIKEPTGQRANNIETGWVEVPGDGLKALILLRSMAAFFGGAVIETDNSSRVVLVETSPVQIILDEKPEDAWATVKLAIVTSPYTQYEENPENNIIKIKQVKDKGFWGKLTPAKKFGVLLEPTADQSKTRIRVTTTKGKDIDRSDALPVLYSIAGELRRSGGAPTN